MACTRTAFLVLVFAAACASAGPCADGSSTNTNGCCAATLECPPCMVKSHSQSSPTPSAESTTCTCSGCPGDTVTIDATCTADSCLAMGRSGGAMGDCVFCSGSDGTCMPNQAAVSACSTTMPGMSISSSGLISGQAVLDCTPCCPKATCKTIADVDKPECAACKACSMQGTACPKDSAAASLSSGVLGLTLLAVTTTALLF